MASPSKPVGYECEFVDQVPEDYFCKQCKHVAREPNITSCCGECFCKACVDAISQLEEPCPCCQSTEMKALGLQVKYNRSILATRVYCSLKDRGCEWNGQLQHLNAHLDLTTGDCVYVDVDCPSKCNQKVQKCNVDTHLANHCPNRDYTCPHCSFKANFREVSEHFEVCRYYPLVCPNRCGASFERDVLEEHMKMCGQQELQCEFSYAGCEAEFIRDDQKEHMEQNTQKHLALVAAATLRISQTFEQKFREQQQEFDQKLEEQQQAFDQKLEDKDSEIKAIVNNEASQLVNEQRQQSEARIKDLEAKLQEEREAQREKDAQVKEQQKLFEEKLGELREEFHKQQRMLEEKLEEKDRQIKTLEEQFGSAVDSLRLEVGILPYKFTLSNYQKAKATSTGSMVSPHMYIRPGGFKFELKVWPSMNCSTHVKLTFCLVKNDQLELPSRLTITLELLNQHRDQDHVRKDMKWVVARSNMDCHTAGSVRTLISHSDLEWNADKQTQYLKNDCLKFRITKIV